MSRGRPVDERTLTLDRSMLLNETADGSPHDFYACLGPFDTGVRHGDENEMKLMLM